MKYLFGVFLVLGLALALSPQPIPTCTPPKNVMSTFPITLNQVQSFNLDDYFTGFNLEFNLSSTAPDFAYLTQKTDLVKSFNQKQPGLKSHHLEHNGNTWGRTLITLSEENWVTKIRWGASNANETIPALTETVTVESEKNIWCYDAVWVRDAQLAIVDCTKAVAFGLQNIFLYVNTSSQVIIPKSFVNDMYTPFTEITRRRMVLLREDGYDYLIRAYYADGVDFENRNNTYLQIMTFNDPFKPRTLKIMDRSFLHQNALSITDFKLYMGNMYILDWHSGVIIFDITPNQNILISGRYRTDSGYLRLGVYSGDLDTECILALANHHAIYEVDFTNQLAPQIITKYSIMTRSQIQSVWVNEEYVLAQISANVTTADNGTAWYNSSIVFSRGTRSYINAYEILEHSTTNVIIDFERANNLALVMEEGYTRLFKINKPVLSILPTNPATMNKQYEFFIQGLSINTYTNHSALCSFNMKFYVVDINNMTLWETGMKLPENYYANYPGELFVPLNRYVLGPNITYTVSENDHPNMSNFWILQQNTTRLHWNKKPSLGKVTFLRQEQFDSIDRTQIYIYTQDSMKYTHFLRCVTVPYQTDVECAERGFMPGINEKIANLTASRFQQYQNLYSHLAAVVYEDMPNQIFIYDVERDEQRIKPIMFSSDPYEGRVTNVEFIGRFLAVLFRYTKEILFYDMRACVDHQEGLCKEMFRINSRTMNHLGVNYFAPVDIYYSDFHPGVLFIQNLDRVIIVSVTRTGVHLLAQIESNGSKEAGFFKFKIGIAQDQLVLVNPPNIIEEHSLKYLYTKRDAPLSKTYPIYNYNIPDKFDLDFSDAGNLIYITAIDKNLPADQNSVILVYRTGYPAVAAFYDVFHINGKYDDMLIDATGSFGDYVTVALGSMLLMFRQYEIPILVFEDSFHDFDFNVSYTNDAHAVYKQHANVKVANMPIDITINDTRLNEPEFLTSQIDYQNDNRAYILNDSTWFNGSVINYTLTDCDECGGKVKVINHLDMRRSFFETVDMEDYTWTPQGGVIQQFQSLLTMKHNGSVEQFVSLPAIYDGESCQHVTFSWLYDFSVSACQTGEEVYLYMTSLVPSKPFASGPYPSGAKRSAGMQTMGDLFILVDVDEEPSRLSREGGVFIYSINHEISEPEIFDEIDFIDTDDLMVAQGWNDRDNKIFIGNAHLVYTNETGIYRLAITELRDGVFFVDFKWQRGQRELEIIKIEFLDLREELLKSNLPMPNMAFFESVAVSKQYYNPTFKIWDVELIVTTRNFHILQVNIGFDKTGAIRDHQIVKVFRRYAYYETTNYIKTFDGYFAVVQKLPVSYESFDWLSKQVLTLYDTKERWEIPSAMAGDIPIYEFLGGYVLGRGRVTFDFNVTFSRNSSDPFKDIGLLVLNSREALIREFLIHDYIGISTEQGIYSTQNAKLVAFNDFSNVTLPLSIFVTYNPFPGWAIALIIIGSLLFAILAGFVGWKLYLKKKAIKDEEPIKKSLLEQQADKSDDDESDDDEDEDDEDGSEQSGQQELKPSVTPSAKAEEATASVINTETNVHGASINRDTVESNLEAEPVAEPGDRPEEAQEAPVVEVAADGPEPGNQE